MRTLRILSALAIISCNVSCALVQAPVKLANGMLNAVGRTLHMSSENTRKPGDIKIESHDAKSELVINKSGAPKPEVADPMIAQL